MIKKPGIPKRIVITFEYPDETDPAHREKEFVLEGDEARAVEALIFRKENVEKHLANHPHHKEICQAMEKGACAKGEPQEEAVAMITASGYKVQCSGYAH